MAQNSKIEWTNHTANLWHGCTAVHEGCDNCYAKALSHRWGHDLWGNDKSRKEIGCTMRDLKRYQDLAEAAGQTSLVFAGSMMDIFEKPMPLIDSKGALLPYKTDALRDKLFNEIIPQSPNLVFLLLTKRPQNIRKYIPASWKTKAPDNVMFGTSVVNQRTADKLIMQLAKVNGRRFISVEPQLAAVNLLAPAVDGDTVKGVLLDYVDWVIVGGESGPRKRPFDTDWARTIRDDCKKKGVPYFFKQIDKVQAIPEDLMVREFPAFEGATARER